MSAKSIIIIITYSSIALISSSIRPCSVRCKNGCRKKWQRKNGNGKNGNGNKGNGKNGDIFVFVIINILPNYLYY